MTDAYAAVATLVAQNPRWSSGQIQAALREAGGPVPSKAQIKEWRTAIKAGTPPPDAIGPLLDTETEDDATTVLDRLTAAIDLGDSASARRWVEVLSKMRTAGVDTAAEAEPELDLGRLTRVQFSAFHALALLAAGGHDADPEVVWWRDMLGRVPEPVGSVHPATIPLPTNPIPETP